MPLTVLDEIETPERQSELRNRVEDSDDFETMKSYFEQLGGGISESVEYYEGRSSDIVKFRSQTDEGDELVLTAKVTSHGVSFDLEVKNPALESSEN